MVEEKFFNNELYLKGKFSFERIGNNLHYLGWCGDDFRVKPSESTVRLCKMLFNRLTRQSCMTEDLRQTLLYSQIRAVLDDYISLAKD